jgi:predicted DNA-binding mobile mystery protein A
MSTVELGVRMGISQSWASRLERGEVDETIRLGTLRRAAQALNCTLHYVLVPDEPLEDMVLRQAHHRATLELMSSDSSVRIASDATSEEEMDEWLEARTLELIDRQGLWLQSAPP